MSIVELRTHYIDNFLPHASLQSYYAATGDTVKCLIEKQISVATLALTCWSLRAAVQFFIRW